jgi:hypothetical protein
VGNLPTASPPLIEKAGKKRTPPVPEGTEGVRRMGWQRRTLPPGGPGSTIRAVGLNFRVRDGIGCIPHAIATSRTCSRASLLRASISACKDNQIKREEEGLAFRKSLAVRRSSHTTGQATRALSTARLSMSPCVHLPPINVVVSHGPSEGLRPGRIHLGGGFPLRCVQRLSRPDLATRRCRWHDNRYTRGQSVPVLSY